MAQTQQQGQEETVGALVAAVSRDMSALVRAEIALAKAELRDDAKNAATGSAMFGAAGFVAVLAVVLFSIAAAFGLTALGLHPGWAFLIVGGAFLLFAAVVGLVGIRAFKKLGPPERTIRTVKDSVAFVKHPRGHEH